MFPRKETGGSHMKKRISLLCIAVAFMGYACAVSCGPGPNQSTKPATYPGGYTLDKQGEKTRSE